MAELAARDSPRPQCARPACAQSGSSPGGLVPESPALLKRDPFRSKLKRPERRLDFSAIAQRPASSAESLPPRAATPLPPRPASSAAAAHGGGGGGAGDGSPYGHADMRRRQSTLAELARMLADSAAHDAAADASPAHAQTAARLFSMRSASATANESAAAGQAGMPSASPPLRGAPQAARVRPPDEVRMRASRVAWPRSCHAIADVQTCPPRLHLRACPPRQFRSERCWEGSGRARLAAGGTRHGWRRAMAVHQGGDGGGGTAAHHIGRSGHVGVRAERAVAHAIGTGVLPPVLRPACAQAIARSLSALAPLGPLVA